MSPRKSLAGSGESRRMIFRVDREVEDILSQVKNKSLFIRKSIIYYWQMHGIDNLSDEHSRKNKTISPNRSNTNFHVEITEDKEDNNEPPTNRVWSPPWKRG
ncbi:MAG: hypothetical protein ACTSW1_01465 [Candidatus Hodarchaeales archaeon]